MLSFPPVLEPLEDRTAPAPLSVGAAAQQGSLLAVGVASSVISTTMILQDGQGDVAVSLNGGDFQIFNGVSNIQVFAQGLGNVIAVFSSASLQIPEQLTMNLTGFFNGLFFHVPSGGANLNFNANVQVPFIPF
jgi:hypothetical protein